MRAFVLCTGRSGSTTFAKACGHIINFTSAHESRARVWQDRLDYPEQHIEVDHRLTWFLGSLDRIYGDDPVYVHLTRDPELTAQSWALRRHKPGQQRQWENVVLYRPEGMQPIDAARLMVQTVTDNINLFLRNKSRVVRLDIGDPHEGFDEFWEVIGAEGDRKAAHRQLNVRHNARRR